MSWNEPGGDKRDPWGNKNNDGPPELDEILKKIKESFGGLFGDGKKGGGSSGSSGDLGMIPVVIFLVLLSFIWVYNSFYQLDEKEKGVVMRFGKFHKTVGPGLSFNPAFIDDVIIESVTSERQYNADGPKSLMLTQDENIVQVPLIVQYNISNVRDFVLNVNDPTATLEQATDSAIRHVVGSASLDSVLSGGRQILRDEVKLRLQDHLDDYGTGINVVDVTLQRGEPPVQVKDAFDDVNAAEADKDRTIDQAEGYRNSVLPAARGQSQRMIEEASAYKGQLVARAQGEAQRFEKLLKEYQRAPEVTRERLYIDTIEQVLSDSSKVMLDVDEGNNMMYLPLDRLQQSSNTSTTAPTEQQVRNTVMDILRELNQNSSQQGVRR